MAHKTEADDSHARKASKKHKSSTGASGELIIDHSSEKVKKAEPEPVETLKADEKPVHEPEAVQHNYLKPEKGSESHSDSEQTLATNKVKDVEPPHETHHHSDQPAETQEHPNVLVPGGIKQSSPNPAGFFRSKYHPKPHQPSGEVFGIMPETVPQQTAYGTPVAASAAQRRSPSDKNRLIIGAFIGAFVLITLLTFFFGVYLPGRNNAVDNPNNVYDLPVPDETQTQETAPSDTPATTDGQTTEEPLPQLTR